MQCLQGCRMKMLYWFMGLLARLCVCMLTCLLSLVIDGTGYSLVLFFCTWFASVAVLRLNRQSVRALVLKNLEKSVPLLQWICERLPPMHPQLWKVPTALYSTASASSFVPGKLCNAAPSDQCKRFWHKKTKSVGTAQTKLNCKIKELRQFSWLYYLAPHLFN